MSGMSIKDSGRSHKKPKQTIIFLTAISLLACLTVGWSTVPAKPKTQLEMWLSPINQLVTEQSENGEHQEDLGFSPHPDYKKAKGLFGKEQPSTCTEEYTYGKDGKPFYINGPYETENRSRQIVEQLHKRCGEGGYDSMVMGPPEGNSID